jgi:hypothetical protein
MNNTRFQNWPARCLAGVFSIWAVSGTAQTPTESPQPKQPDNRQVEIIDPKYGRYFGVSDELPDDWTRHFRVGGMVGLNIKADFRLESGAINISGNPAGRYGDGYVLVDQTGNAQGYTSNWGYDNASQYDGQSLTMHSASSFSTAGFKETSDDTAPPGFDMAYGGNLWKWGRTRLGWEFGFGLMPINISDTPSLAGEVTQSSYTFDTGGIIVPDAPYQGGPSGGPVIHDTYTGSDTTMSPGSITDTETLDVNLYSFRLGPSAYWDVSRYVGVSVGAGPALGLVSGSLDYNQKITANGVTTRNKGHIDGTELIYGGYVNASAMFHLVENGDIYLGVQYMPMTEANFSGQGHKASLQLNGQVLLSVGFSWPF